MLSGTVELCWSDSELDILDWFTFRRSEPREPREPALPLYDDLPSEKVFGFGERG